MTDSVTYVAAEACPTTSLRPSRVINASSASLNRGWQSARNTRAIGCLPTTAIDGYQRATGYRQLGAAATPVHT
jgi:hypothetical protein